MASTGATPTQNTARPGSSGDASSPALRGGRA